jgi:hypothetical protein
MNNERTRMPAQQRAIARHSQPTSTGHSHARVGIYQTAAASTRISPGICSTTQSPEPSHYTAR